MDFQQQLGTEIARQLRDLQGLAVAGRWAEFAELAHKLRGLAALYGQVELVAVAAELERLARRGETASLRGDVERLLSLQAESKRS